MNDILNKLHEAAASPRAQMDGYLAQGKKIVLCAPVYTPEELIHAMGFVPMGAWGGDVALNRAKEYCPAFLCAIVQSLLELGINGAYEGASAIVIPSLCDTLKTVGENWKYAVPSIPFIPMTYPQNRKPAYGVAYTKAGYERVIRDLEKLGGAFSEEKLLASIKIYNRHNAAMRKIDELLAGHPEITAAQRSDIFKSAFFMTKEEHTELVEALIEKLEAQTPAAEKLPIVISGILTDAPALNAILDEMGLHIVADDVAAQSRQYRTDAPERDDAPERAGREVRRHGQLLCAVRSGEEPGEVDRGHRQGEKRQGCSGGADQVLRPGGVRLCDDQEGLRGRRPAPDAGGGGPSDGAV